MRKGVKSFLSQLWVMNYTVNLLLLPVIPTTKMQTYMKHFINMEWMIIPAADGPRSIFRGAA